jgi:hypothetical protein
VAGKVGQGRDGWRCRAGQRRRVVHAFTKGGVGQGGGQGREGMGGGRAGWRRKTSTGAAAKVLCGSILSTNPSGPSGQPSHFLPF